METVSTTSMDLVLTLIMQRTKCDRDHALTMLRQVGRREPILSLWLDDVYYTAIRCAEAVIDAASEQPASKPDLQA